MNKQEIFDTVVKHLRQQNCKAMRDPEGGRCMYRGYNNTKCAIGCLIPDSEYKEWMELAGIINLLPSYKDFPESLFWMKDHMGFLMDLQYIHDQMDVSDWEFYFEKFAVENNLTVPA